MERRAKLKKCSKKTKIQKWMGDPPSIPEKDFETTGQERQKVCHQGRKK